MKTWKCVICGDEQDHRTAEEYEHIVRTITVSDDWPEDQPFPSHIVKRIYKPPYIFFHPRIEG